jgi:hypothetical protein
MRYVLLRDDDTNALTPVHCLERLYRPWLDRGLPVNLAVIPNVRTDAKTPDHQTEAFLFGDSGSERCVPIGDNSELVGYLLDNRGYHVVQHGYDHQLFEFDSADSDEICHRLDQGAELLRAARLPVPEAFVAPYDRFSRVSLFEAARRFPVVSTGWFEAARVPLCWWPRYFIKKISCEPHWRVGRTALLTHPGCLLSRFHHVSSILDSVLSAIQRQRLTVLVTHWWEYFPAGEPDEYFISILHETAELISRQPDVSVVSFADVSSGSIPLD